MAGRQAVTVDDLGAWLFKAAPTALHSSGAARTGFSAITTRCVRPSYRTDLLRAGQPVLLWVSGRDPRHPAGIHAGGRTTGPAAYDTPEPFVPVRLHPVTPYVPRADLLADPVLSRLEVVRMPAGSNPSYLDTEQWAALLDAFPAVGVAWRTA